MCGHRQYTELQFQKTKRSDFVWGGIYETNWTELNLKGKITAYNKDLFWCCVTLMQLKMNYWTGPPHTHTHSDLLKHLAFL